MLPEPSRAQLPFIDRVERVLGRHARFATWCLVWFGSLIAAFYYLGVILREDMYANDMAIHLPWTYRLADPSLFPSDAVQDYLQQFSPAGIKALFWATSWCDPRLVAKLSALPLHAVVLYLLYRVGCELAGKRKVGGWLAVCLVASRLTDPWGSVWFAWFQGAMARSFAFPVLLWAALGILTGRVWMLGAACLVGSLLYPPAALTLGLLCGTLFLLDERPLPARLRAWSVALALAALAGTYLATLSWAGNDSRFGALITLAQAKQMDEYGPGGPLSTVLPTKTVLGSMLAVRFGLYPQLIVLGVAYFWMWRRRLVEPRFGRLAGAWLAVGFTLFVAAYLLLFRLYEPSRYVYLAYYMATIFLAVPVGVRVLDAIGGWLTAATSAAKWRALAFVRRYRLGLVFAGMALATLLTGWITARRCVAGKGGNPPMLPHEIYDAMRALPREVVIAGHPADISDVPLFTKRSAYYTAAVFYPYHDAFHREMRGRLVAYSAAAYASDWSQVVAFAKRSGVGAVLVNDARYGTQPPRWLPVFDREVDSAREAARGREPILLHPAPERVLARSGAFSLVDVRPIARDANAHH